MKKFINLTLVLALALVLTACGSKTEAEVWDTGDVQALLDSVAFSEELEELDKDTAFILYRLADYGLDRLSGAVVFRSAGASLRTHLNIAMKFTLMKLAKKSSDRGMTHVPQRVRVTFCSLDVLRENGFEIEE